MVKFPTYSSSTLTKTKYLISLQNKTIFSHMMQADAYVTQKMPNFLSTLYVHVLFSVFR